MTKLPQRIERWLGQLWTTYFSLELDKSNSIYRVSILK